LRFAKFYEIWNLKLLNFIKFYLRDLRLLARRKVMRALVSALYKSRAAQGASVRHTLRRSKRTAGVGAHLANTYRAANIASKSPHRSRLRGVR